MINVTDLMTKAVERVEREDGEEWAAYMHKKAAVKADANNPERFFSIEEEKDEIKSIQK